MEIKRIGSVASCKGPSDYLTGTVRAQRGTRIRCQTLIVTSGCGRVQRWSGPIEEIRP